MSGDGRRVQVPVTKPAACPLPDAEWAALVAAGKERARQRDRELAERRAEQARAELARQREVAAYLAAERQQPTPERPGAATAAEAGNDDLAHVPDGDGPEAGGWLAGLGAGAGNAGTTQTGGRD